MPDDRLAGRPGGEDPAAKATRRAAAPTYWRAFTTPAHYESVGSTNEVLAKMARSGAPEGTVVTASSQTAGRGRLDRRWLDAPGGSVLCSVLFRPRWGPKHLCLAPLVVSLAAARAAEAVAGVYLKAKWPNDLVGGAEEHKVAGLLSEVLPGPEGRPGGIVVGLGLNCYWAEGFGQKSEEEREVARSATTLSLLAGSEIDPRQVIPPLLDEVERRWSQLSPHGEAPDEGAARAAIREYRRRSSTIGRLVVVETESERLTGTAADVDDEGRLVLECATGTTLVSVGDVVHLRPTDDR